MTYNQPARKYPSPKKIASIENLNCAWRFSRDNNGKGGAPGIDGVRPATYKKKLNDKLSALRKKLLNRDYSFSRLKPIFIPKDNGKWRVICIPTVEDRLVQRLILRHLTIDEKTGKNRDKLDIDTDFSFGVAKGMDQGVHAAIKKAMHYRASHQWVLKTDISQFFDKIPRNKLKKFLRSRLKNSSAVPLIEKIIDCELQIKNKHDAERIANNGIVSGIGLRQGMPLSPLLSNLILNKFDKKMAASGIKIVRYADDLIAFCNTQNECKELLEVIKSELSKLELSIPDIEENTKTAIRKPGETIVFLGVEIYQQKDGTYAQRIPDETKIEAIKDLQSHSDLSWNLKKDFTLPDVIRRMKNIPEGYKSAFVDCTNLNSFLIELRQKSHETKQTILINIFGETAIDSLTNDQRKFLGFE